jgi:hypothetical protein
MSLILASVSLTIFIAGCKKDDFDEIAGICPLVESTNPASDAVNVPLDQIITATFNEKMNPATITQTSFDLSTLLGTTNSSVAGTVSYNEATMTLSFKPTNPLASNTTYTGTVKTNVKDLRGNALQTDYIWSFSTSSIIYPQVTSTDPENNATGVVLNKIIEATFNMPMDPLTFTASTFIVKNGETTVPGSISYDEGTAFFDPANDLAANTLYTVTLTTGIKNVEGVTLQNNYVWSFTTGTTIAPRVISTDPENLETEVAIDKIVIATFSMQMDPSTITTSTFTLYNGISQVAGAVTYSGTTATFTPAIPLLPNTIYTGTITTGAKNVAGVPIANKYVWRFTTIATAPVVISTDPANGATQVVLNKIVTATFSVPMNPWTITSSTFTLKHGTTSVDGSVSYSGTTATFKPNSVLLANTVYTGTITTGAESEAGIALAENYVWTFTTGSITAPTVISTDPANGATGVLLDKTITATFSTPMDPLTMNSSTFRVMNGLVAVAGVVTYSGSTISFNPTGDLLPGTVYTATITTGAKNLAGVPLANDYVWTFTTISVSAPTVLFTDPTNNAVGVVLNKIVTATFSEAMNPLTLNTGTFTLRNGANAVSGMVSYAGTMASFAPAGDLLPGTLYTATLTTEITNLAGVSLTADYIWTFTTLTPMAPLVISTDPQDNAINVVLNKTVTASFNMQMDPLTINTSTFTLYEGTNMVAGMVTYSGTTASFNPLSDLLPGTLYTATLTTAVTNVAGVSLTENYIWTFTTETSMAPLVISTDPLNNATNVALNKTVTATFNMQMDPLTINTSTFTLYQGANMVNGIVTYSGTTASFNPSGDLLAGLTYTATITTGAMNTSGTPLENDYVWSFSTQAEVIPGVDLGSASIFGAFGGNAGITNQGINTVINGAIATTGASTLVTGFHDGLTGDVYTETPLNVGLVTNGIYTAPPFPGTATTEAIAIQGLLDATDAYNSISPASMPGGIDPGAGELGNLTLAPGVYMSASGTFNISNGPLTLDAQGDPNAIFVFQTAAGLTVGIAGPTGARSVNLINGASDANVFWYVGSAATINAAGGGIMVGTIISMAGVTFSTPGNAVQTVLNGRAISLVASVTMVNTTINVPAE